MRVHLIAIGGSAMHNLALALYYNHHTVTGSDDEIYNPARDRLAAVGLLPSANGWFPAKITTDIDVIILGMHARKDNPELQKALDLGIPVLSYPEFIYERSKDKIRIVIAGSHGKTTTTSMILHVLNSLVLQDYDIDLRFDYLVGAQLEGFDRMVQLSDAPIIIIEGDEYLSSPIDRRPKFLHYRPHIVVITGIAWDHINVFPSFKEYADQFNRLIESVEPDGKIFYYEHDAELQKRIKVYQDVSSASYNGFKSELKEGVTFLFAEPSSPVKAGLPTSRIPLRVFGQHNLENLRAAYLVCHELGVRDNDFYVAIKSFDGAAKRLQILQEKKESIAFLDFAHAPSKVEATIKAVKGQYPDRQLVAVVELHTFSSLNKTFIDQYKETMEMADEAVVFYSEHTLKMKKLPAITPEDIQGAFDHRNLLVFRDVKLLYNHLKASEWHMQNLLLMTSGTFGGMELNDIIT
jgi:UDP-N-acetylmuramate: L-alanyl-gamma-D-glutamyl-meso-diaminopimelate ligase